MSQHDEHSQTKDRWLSILADPELMQTICAHVSNGGSLIDLAEMWQVPYGWMMNWIHNSAEREALFKRAKEDRTEWCMDAVLREVQRVALADIRQLYNTDGSMKPPHEWPDSVASAVASVQTDELFEGVGRDRQQIGETKRVTLWPKMKGLELLGKTMRMFVDVHEHKVATLESLVVETAAVQPDQPALTGDVDNSKNVDNSVDIVDNS
jgi:hypothetical protein